MRIFDRILLFFYALLIVALSLGFIVLAWQFVPQDRLIATIQFIQQDWRWPAIITAIAVVFIIISVRLLVSGLRKRRAQNAVIKTSETGNVAISIRALEMMVKRYTDQIDSISDIQTRITNTREGINLFLRVAFKPETHIAQATEDLQTGLTSYIVDYSSVPVKSVQVFVDQNKPVENRPVKVS